MIRARAKDLSNLFYQRIHVIMQSFSAAHRVCVSLDHKSDRMMTNWPTDEQNLNRQKVKHAGTFYNLSTDHHDKIFNNMQFVFSSQSDLSTGR